MTTLLDRLDLDREGLEPVKAAADQPDLAAKALLEYYRSRDSVKHPVDRKDKPKARGKYASERDLKVADDAVKHVFISQRSYPPHFVGEDIRWDKSPVPDNEWLWQLHRMYFWRSLARAYWHTGDEKYAKAWCDQLVDWVRKNPNDGKHGYAWRPIEAGIRGHSWMSHYQHFVDSPHFTPDVLVTFLNSCHDHAAYLTGREFHRQNHGLMEAEGSAFIAILFPEFKNAARWRRKAIRYLTEQVNKQVRADGHQVEQCMNYHCGCIGWFTRTAELARLNGREDEFPDEFWRRIEKMVAAVMKLTPPGGRSAQFGDTSSQVDCRRVLRRRAKTFDRDDFRYVGTGGKRGRAPAQTAYALKESGFYSMRSSWGEKAIGLVLKCGPGGYWHCQPDNGTFELWAYGRRLMPDSGTYIYHGDAAGRRWFQQTRVHQTLTLDGANADYGAKCLLWRPGDDLDALVVRNRSYKGLTHRRAVLFVKKRFFVLVDDAVGRATGNVDLHFQLAPGEAVFDRRAPSVRTDFDDANVLVRAVPRDGMTLAKEKGQVSFHYGEREPRPAFRFRVRKTGGGAVRFVTLVVPYKGKRAPEANIELVGDPTPGSKTVELDVSVGKTAARVGYDLDAGEAWLRGQ
ncbi:MAG: alginate lyase family protein [Planctomycetota bacterium]